MKIKAHRTKTSKAKTKDEFADTDLDELEAQLRSELGENVGEDEVDLDEMNKRQLLKFAKENDITVKAPGKKDEDEVREIIQEALDGDGGEDELDELEDILENEEDGGDEDESDDIEDMDKSELLEYIEENDLDIPKAKSMPKKKLLKAVQKALDEMDEGSEDEGDEDGDIEVDPSEMSKKEILKFIKDNDLEDDIGITLKKAKALSTSKLRKLLTESFGSDGDDEGDEDLSDEDLDDLDNELDSDEGEGDEDEVDIDDMSKKDIVSYIKDNMEELGITKAKLLKVKKFPLAKLKKYLVSLVESANEEEGGDGDEVDISSMGKKDLYKLIKDNDLDIALADARKMKVAKLRKVIIDEVEGGGKSKKSSKSAKSKNEYLTSKKVKLLERKLTTISKHVEALLGVVEEGEAITRKSSFNKFYKKVKTINELSSDIDDVVEEASNEND